MARPLRLEFENAVYHITSRGNAGDAIFLDEADCEAFLKVLAEVVKRYNWLCYAYCLMINHYHLLIETPDANLSFGMRQLNGVYTQRFNHRHKHTGHIFQGRYKSILVDKEAYLLELIRYVILNPVRAGVVSSPEDWDWSSYRATAGLSPLPSFISSDWLLSQFDTTRHKAEASYRKFISERTELSPLKHVRNGVILGAEGFVESLAELLGEKRKLKEIPRKQRFADRPSLPHIFARSKKDKSARNEAVYEAHHEHGYTLTEIANHLALHYSTISKVLGNRRQNS